MLEAPSAVLWAAWATCTMFSAISPLPVVASAMLRLISPVVADCSSTAAAIRVWSSSIRPMTEPISAMAATARAVSCCIDSIRPPMSSVALAVSRASSLTSLATTAKPLPASPARAASIVALRASRLVCSAIEVITFTTAPISPEERPRASIVVDVTPAISTARRATAAASCALRAISWMLVTRLSIDPDTVRALPLTCSAAAETRFAWAVVSSAAALICWLTLVSSSEALASACVLSTIPWTSRACRSASRVIRRAMSVETASTPRAVSPNTPRPNRHSRDTGASTSAWSISEISAQRTPPRPVESPWIVTGRQEASTGAPR